MFFHNCATCKRYWYKKSAPRLLQLVHDFLQFYSYLLRTVANGSLPCLMLRKSTGISKLANKRYHKRRNLQDSFGWQRNITSSAVVGVPQCS